MSVLHGLRFIFVLGDLELGGAERQALLVARHLVEREQAKVEIWGFNRTGPVASLCEAHQIPCRVIEYPPRAGPLRRKLAHAKLVRSLRKARPDVLLPYTFLPNVVCGLIWQKTGARLCVWNQRDEGLVATAARWEKRAVRQTPRFISNSRAGARYLVQELRVDPARISVVHNGVELASPQLDRQSWRKRLEIEEDSFVACMIANLHAHKDHATLLQAWRMVAEALKSAGRNAVLVLAGRHYGAYESLVALTKELRIAAQVRFAGQVEDVAGLLGAVDLGVFSSRSEGCPNGLLECMAAGLAVAATNVEGIREVVGTTEFLAPPGDASRLATIILKLAADPGLCASSGAANRSRVATLYDPRRLVHETVAVLVESY